MNRPDATAHPRRWLAPALIALGAWLVIELLFIGQAMHVDSCDLGEAIKLTLPRTEMWLVFAPLAVALAFWFPLERGRLARSLAVHLAACVLLMVAVHLPSLVSRVPKIAAQRTNRRPRSRNHRTKAETCIVREAD